MKKFKTFFIINQSIYWSIYLIKTFTIWKFTNPFQWIIDMSTYREYDRFFILFGILLVIALEIFIAKTSMDDKDKFTNI